MDSLILAMDLDRLNGVLCWHDPVGNAAVSGAVTTQRRPG
jgi:hypothetical protein